MERTRVDGAGVGRTVESSREPECGWDGRQVVAAVAARPCPPVLSCDGVTLRHAHRRSYGHDRGLAMRREPPHRCPLPWPWLS